MSDFSPSRRQVLAAVGSIGVGSAAVGAGTFAAFSDTEQSTGNSFETGTLELTKGTQTLSFSASSVQPGASGKTSVVLQSDGSIGGDLDVSLANVTNTDVTETDAEQDAENGTNVPLADQLELKMWVEEATPSSGSEGTFDPQYDYGLKSDGSVANGSGATLTYDDVSAYPTGNAYTTASFVDGASSSTDKEFYVEWRLPSSATNAVQGDKTTVDFDFTLNQA